MTTKPNNKAHFFITMATNTRRQVLFVSIVLLTSCFFPGNTVSAQTNRAASAESTEANEVFFPSPARAAMLSATLPGMGQFYNQKYWKIPIIYAGFGALVYFIDFNNTYYREYRRAWLARVDGNPNTVDDYPRHSTDVLERAMNFHRRNLEITYILSAALYLLNILDASVDAHLANFDVGETLSLGLKPASFPDPVNRISSLHSAHLSLRIRF